ncbi:Cysteine desulfurase [Lactococcus lactis subsp. lactis NCDO 2118]|uniref:Cysteine desulfurase n=1 Tax=Lactococcus lactis subsp. lactis NCDO 2118 TaxID=1117941 RepID=A0ABC8A4S4_LACLL|nr:Cysteine desulfurase [Lactococcus lactis subsp. lactis NCDO 2118]BAL50605.1 cysteine desulfurase [Lactococcus lactis subsp. lactis IO-1]
MENGLPTASCLKTNGNKFLSFTHRRLRGVYLPFFHKISFDFEQQRIAFQSL